MGVLRYRLAFSRHAVPQGAPRLVDAGYSAKPVALLVSESGHGFHVVPLEDEPRRGHAILREFLGEGFNHQRRNRDRSEEPRSPHPCRHTRQHPVGEVVGKSGEAECVNAALALGFGVGNRPIWHEHRRASYV